MSGRYRACLGLLSCALIGAAFFGCSDDADEPANQGPSQATGGNAASGGAGGSSSSSSGGGDQGGGDQGGAGGQWQPPTPTGNCEYPSTDLGTGKGFGESCTHSSECQYGKCLMPGEDGNSTNEQFGFCTRGCDCGDTGSQLTALEKQSLVCLYPSGGAGAWRHVVLRCDTVSDCLAVDSKWTGCRMPDSGAAQTVCHAEP